MLHVDHHRLSPTVALAGLKGSDRPPFHDRSGLFLQWMHLRPETFPTERGVEPRPRSTHERPAPWRGPWASIPAVAPRRGSRRSPRSQLRFRSTLVPPTGKSLSHRRSSTESTRLAEPPRRTRGEGGAGTRRDHVAELLGLQAPTTPWRAESHLSAACSTDTAGPRPILFDHPWERRHKPITGPGLSFEARRPRGCRGPRRRPEPCAPPRCRRSISQRRRWPVLPPRTMGLHRKRSAPAG
jgi:hypothetical protein